LVSIESVYNTKLVEYMGVVNTLQCENGIKWKSYQSIKL